MKMAVESGWVFMDGFVGFRGWKFGFSRADIWVFMDAIYYIKTKKGKN
jgi:hypothetical protein